MSWKPDNLVKVCDLNKGVWVEYELYNATNKPNRLEFRKGKKFLFEIFEEKIDTLENFISDLTEVWHNSKNVKPSVSIFNKFLLQIIGGSVIASSAENHIKLLNQSGDLKNGNIVKASVNRQNSWLIHKLKRNNTSSIVLFKQKRSNSSVGINQKSKLVYNWIKIPSDKVDLLIESLKKLLLNNSNKLIDNE